MFQKTKLAFLAKEDKSRKGYIDEPIQGLIDIINDCAEYYTTSSCSGRILIIDIKEKKRKDCSEFLLNAHAAISGKQLLEVLNNSDKENVWLLVQPPILHIATPTLECGMTLLRKMRNQGCKRAGIISSTTEKTIVEIKGTEQMELPLALKNTVLLSPSNAEILVTEANKKMEISHDTIKKWEKTFSLPA